MGLQVSTELHTLYDDFESLGKLNLFESVSTFMLLLDDVFMFSRKLSTNPGSV